MKQVLFAATVLAGFATSGSAFADRWVQPINGTVSAVPMADGSVMMKIVLPAKELQMVDRDMRASNTICLIKAVDPGKAGGLILVCGLKGSVVQ